MVSQQVLGAFVALLLAQVAVALPMESTDAQKSPDAAKCEALMHEAIGFVNSMSQQFEIARNIPANLDAALKSCKETPNPDLVSECEEAMKTSAGLESILLLARQAISVSIARNDLPDLAKCRPQSFAVDDELHQLHQLHAQLLSLTNQVEARNIKTCFGILSESRDQLAELAKLMDAVAVTKKALAIRAQVPKCFKPNLDRKCLYAVVRDNRDDVFAILGANLKWKDAAQTNINRFAECMAS